MSPDMLYRRLVVDVCLVTGVDTSELLSRSRRARVSRARQAVWWLLREVGGLSYPQIGDMVGRDHTTVVHGVQRAGTDPRIREIVDSVVQVNRAVGSATVPRPADTR